MSWLDRLNNIELTITTGDGKVYTPLWKNARKEITYNVAGFNFVGIPGTFVQREERIGSQYPIELYFEGEDCIDRAREFEVSARDKRSWLIKHPFYDEIRVQPLSIEIIDENYNISQINVTVWETLTEKFPEQSVIPEKEIQAAKIESDKIVVEAYDVSPETSLIEKATTAIDSIEVNYQGLVESNEDAAALKNLASSATSAAIQIVSAPLNFVRETQALINFPFQIVNTVRNKIDQLVKSINSLASIFTQDSSNEVELATYDAFVSTSLTELCNVTTDPQEGDFTKRKKVLEAIAIIDDAYFSVLTNYDNNAYAQNPRSALSVDNIVNSTLANLFQIAFNSEQERSIFLEQDNNIINLAHRFYGPGDANIIRLIDENELSRTELLQVKKGRKLIWYV
jgi:hypothetical protein